MNIYAIIILTTLILSFLLENIADMLNLKNLDTKLPDEFKGVYDLSSYKKSQNYTKIRTKFGFITSTFDLIILLIFWFAGGFNYLDLLCRNWISDEIIRGVVYIGILIFANVLISLPFDIYSTFVIEEKFGFNKTTAKTFIIDLLKSFLLSIVLGAPLLYGLLYILQYMGQWAWLYGWVVVVVFVLIVQFIAPRWIMPLFNKFKPLENGSLKDKIMNYAQSVNYSLQNIFIIDGSKRTTKSNAFFTGFGKNKRIALYDTLVEKHTEEEILVILAHEIGHYKKKHILIGMFISIVHTGILFFLLSLFLKSLGLYQAFYMQNIPIYAGLIFFGLLYSPIELLLSIIMNIKSRKNEFQADRFAVTTTKLYEDMINALKKLSLNNLSNLTPHKFYVFLNYSHPTVLERIRAIKELALQE